MNSIPQYKDPKGYFFEMVVPGASPADLERGVMAAWDFFNAANVHPWDAAVVEWELETWMLGDPAPENAELAGMWTQCQHLAIAACCMGWPVVPDSWELNLKSICL